MAKTILLYGRTNSGKSTQIGNLAEHVYKTTGKKTRLYTADKGGVGSILPYIELGVIESVEMGESDPWIFLNRSVRGFVRDPAGKWVAGKNDEIGMFAFESMRGIAESLLLDMAIKAGQGVNIGGSANVAFGVSGDGETLKVSGNNMAHYMIGQARMTEEIFASQKLPGQYLIWTSSVSKEDDTTAGGKVLGPDVMGKALTTEVPRWFDFTFRIDVLPAQANKPERHILYLGTHTDVGAGNAAGLGNIRRPLDAPALKEITIEPANLVQALQLLSSGHDVAKDAIRKRLNLKEAVK